MTEPDASVDAAFEQMISAARAHLTAVRAASGRVDDEAVRQAYVALNNSSYEYDEALLDAYGEATPWDVGRIDDAQAGRVFGDVDETLAVATDPYPEVISVRQRRDYRVPSVVALLALAEQARHEAAPEEADEDEAVEGVHEAVLELLQAGNGSLDALDVPELEPLDGIVTVVEVREPLDLDAYDESDGEGPFELGEGDRVLARLDEQPYGDLEPDEDEDDLEEL
jgi:hypothetical protein